MYITLYKMKKSKKKSVVAALNSIKGKVKDEYMLNLFESEGGSLENLKKANGMFDKVFLSIQMRLIIWIVGIAIGILLYYYFRFVGLHFLMAFSISILLSYMIKKSLELLGIALLRRKA